MCWCWVCWEVYFVECFGTVLAFGFAFFVGVLFVLDCVRPPINLLLFFCCFSVSLYGFYCVVVIYIITLRRACGVWCGMFIPRLFL